VRSELHDSGSTARGGEEWEKRGPEGGVIHSESTPGSRTKKHKVVRWRGGNLDGRRLEP